MVLPNTVSTAHTIPFVVISLGADEVITVVMGVIFLVGMQSRCEKKRSS